MSATEYGIFNDEGMVEGQFWIGGDSPSGRACDDYPCPGRPPGLRR